MGVLTDISFCWTIISIVCTAHNCWLINTTFFPLTNTTATSCADLQLCHKITFCCHDRWQKDGLTLLLLQSAPLAIMGQCLQSELQYETSVYTLFWRAFLKALFASTCNWKEQVHSSRVPLSLTRMWVTKKQAAGCDTGGPKWKSFHYHNSDPPHKSPYRNSALSWSRATDMSYSLFGMTQWRLSLSDENNWELPAVSNSWNIWYMLKLRSL